MPEEQTPLEWLEQLQTSAYREPVEPKHLRWFVGFMQGLEARIEQLRGTIDHLTAENEALREVVDEQKQ